METQGAVNAMRAAFAAAPLCAALATPLHAQPAAPRQSVIVHMVDHSRSYRHTGEHSALMHDVPAYVISLSKLWPEPQRHLFIPMGRAGDPVKVCDGGTIAGRGVPSRAEITPVYECLRAVTWMPRQEGDLPGALERAAREWKSAGRGGRAILVLYANPQESDTARIAASRSLRDVCVLVVHHFPPATGRALTVAEKEARDEGVRATFAGSGASLVEVLPLWSGAMQEWVARKLAGCPARR
jgi:hypothetical protein